MNTLNHLPFSTKFAIGSFLIVTLLFVSYLTTKNENLLFSGFIYVLTAIVLNTIVALYLLYELITKEENKEETAIRLLIVLANIPIAYYYMTVIFSHF